jgi:integrase/recombinase XerC
VLFGSTFGSPNIMNFSNSKPHYRGSRNSWFVIVDGKRITLPVKGKSNRKEANRIWKEMQRELASIPPPTASQPITVSNVTALASGGEHPETSSSSKHPHPSLTFGELLRRWLDAKEPSTKRDTYQNYRWRVNNVLKCVESSTSITEINPALIEKSLNRPEWSKSYQGDLIRTIRMAISWGKLNRFLREDPLEGIKRPKASTRSDHTISPEGFAKLLLQCDDSLRLFLRFCYSTGCRPSEARTITRKDIDLGKLLVILADHKTVEETGKPRIIVIPAEFRESLEVQMDLYPLGAIFRRVDGTPWNRHSLSQAMRKAVTKAGPELASVTPYMLRHSYITDALEKGIPEATVAALAGHASTTMIHKHYSHLGNRIDSLRDSAELIRGTENNNGIQPKGN